MESLEDVYGCSSDGGYSVLKCVSSFIIVLSFVGFVVGIFSTGTSGLYEFTGIEYLYIVKFGTVIVGLSVILLFTGIVSLLPHTREFTSYWISGKVLSISGVLVFTFQYPESWSIFQLDTIFLTGVLYISGVSLLVYQIVLSINSMFDGSVATQIVSRDIGTESDDSVENEYSGDMKSSVGVDSVDPNSLDSFR